MELLRQKLSFLSQLMFILEQIVRQQLQYSMSFILQKLNSSDQLLDSQPSLQSNKDFFSFREASFQNARELSLFQSKSIIFKFFCSFSHSFLVLCVFLLAKFEQKEQQEILLGISSLFASFSVIFYIFGELNLHKLKDKGRITQNHSFFNSTSFKILTALFYSLHPNNYMSQSQIEFNNQYYKINSLLSILVCLRIFSLIVFFIQTSRFYGLRVVRLAQLYANKDKFSLKYALKCLYKQKGIKMPIFMLVVGLLIICFIDVNFQRAMNLTTDFMLSLYDSVITMATVGYGEIDHQNRFQRTKCIFLAILGSFISSVLTLTILNCCEFNQKEMKAYITLKRLQIKENIKQQNRHVVRSAVKRRKGASSNDSFDFHDKIKSYKGSLSHYYWSDNLLDFYIKRNNTVSFGIKKIVEKQLIIKTLMNFFISRRKLYQESFIIQDVQGEEAKTPKSINSNKSRNRKEDTKEIMKLWQKILADQQKTRRSRAYKIEDQWSS